MEYTRACKPRCRCAAQTGGLHRRNGWASFRKCVHDQQKSACGAARKSAKEKLVELQRARFGSDSVLAGDAGTSFRHQTISTLDVADNASVTAAPRCAC
jgi:hypothetical protein